MQDREVGVDMRQYFGTDGIRGRANQDPMTVEVVAKVGMAAGIHFRRGDHKHRVVIGKDTRRSCYMIEYAMAAGFVSVGMDVLLLGPVPTPGVAKLTRSMRADLGVMISASHNSFEDNGIKLFGPDGYKLSDSAEAAIEKGIGSDLSSEKVDAGALGQVRRLQGALERYSEFCKSASPKNLRLDGLKIVVDAANGAGYRVVPEALWELGADVIPLGVDPDGTNINRNCGSTAPEMMQQAVRDHGADIGIAVDGDADRAVFADEKGALVHGDQIVALVSDWLNKRGELTGGCIVGTVMSNLGLERFLKDRNLGLERAPVGDRYIVERMLARGCNVGGEPSGHMVFTDHSTTGDGLIAALQVLAVLVENGRRMSDIAQQFEPVPQASSNVHFNGGMPLESDVVKSALRNTRKDLLPDGRLVVRKSGTEPLIRIMVEHPDGDLARRLVVELEGTIRQAAAEAGHA